MSTTLTGSITTEPVSGSLSYCPTVTLSHSHTVTMSHCHTPTPTLSHPPPLPSLPGQLGVHDEGVEAPGGHPLALGAGGQRPGAGQVEHCLALLALAGSVQVKWVHRSPVPTHLTDKASPTADQAGEHMSTTHLDPGLQNVPQFPPVELLQILETVGIRPCVQILSGPHHLSQADLHPLSLTNTILRLTWEGIRFSLVLHSNSEE